MPLWLQQQLMRAYSRRDRRNIKMLNECWFQYRNASSS
jgi:hypothetical protein